MAVQPDAQMKRGFRLLETQCTQHTVTCSMNPQIIHEILTDSTIINITIIPFIVLYKSKSVVGRLRL